MASLLLFLIIAFADTLVLLVCPFAKLVEEGLSNPGSMLMKDICLQTLPMTLKVTWLRDTLTRVWVFLILETVSRPARFIKLRRSCRMRTRIA